MEPAASPLPPTGRLHALDAVRAGAMLLGVYLHGALAYMHTPHGVSPVVDRSQSFFFDATVVGIHGFRMQLFYVVAGFFAAMLLERRGIRGFLANRVRRVFVPMVLAAAVVCPLVAWTFIAGREVSLSHTADDGPWIALYHAAASGRWVLGYAIPMHLWFLWYLGVMCLLLAGGVWSAGRLGLHLSRARRFVAYSATRFGGMGLLVLLTTLATVPMSQWMIETPASWLISPATLGYYGLFFLWGYLLRGTAEDGLQLLSRRWGGPVWWKAWGPLLGFAAASYLLLGVVGGGLTPRWEALLAARGISTEWAYLPAAAIQAAFTWSMVFAAFVLALRYLSHPPHRAVPVIRYLSDASYWIYLVHLPIVYVLQVLLYPVDAGAFTKALVVVVVTSALSVVTYHYCVRHTLIGRLLNGTRRQ